MSAAKKEEEIDTMYCCANCGVAGVDEVKLKDCSACHLVKYCSVKCQKDHRPKHKKECKKRAAELHDELLFKQPEGNHFGDCPICCLPLPLDPQKAILNSCCSKRICDGCDLANKRRELEGRLEQKCAFCRKTLPNTNAECNRQLKKRVEANDPLAICRMGREIYDEGDYKGAFEYWTRAAALGDVEAHYPLSVMYWEGEGVAKDDKKAQHHAEQAAISGHPMARYDLGFKDWENGRVDRAVKHWIIAAKLGHEKSLERIKALYKAGLVSKESFEAALRGHHAAIDATKSPQREEAAELERQAARKEGF